MLLQSTQVLYVEYHSVVARVDLNRSSRHNPWTQRYQRQNVIKKTTSELSSPARSFEDVRFDKVCVSLRACVSLTASALGFLVPENGFIVFYGMTAVLYGMTSI